MKRVINKAYHAAGGLAFAYGAILAIKAAGMADLGGDLNELVRVGLCGVAAMACGVLLATWKV